MYVYFAKHDVTNILRHGKRDVFTALDIEGFQKHNFMRLKRLAPELFSSTEQDGMVY
jgi:hypothetical protein